MISIQIENIIKYILERKDSRGAVEDRNSIIRYAILAEAKGNNDLAGIIHRANAENAAHAFPNLYNEFSTATSDILISLGIPAYKILDNNSSQPQESTIQEMDRSKNSRAFFEKKSPSELYEFYIRKCSLLKSLCNSSSLAIRSIRLGARLKNIEFATSALITKMSVSK